MKRIILAIFLSAGGLLGQAVPDFDGDPVNVSAGPSARDYTTRYFYNGSSNIEYACTCAAAQPSKTWTVASADLTNIVVTSNVGVATFAANHGLYINNAITVQGGSVTAFVNTTYKITAVTDTTVTFSVTVADGTYTTGLQIVTTAPRTTQPIWKITHYEYAGGSSVTAVQTSAWKQICDNRAATGVTTQITYR